MTSTQACELSSRFVHVSIYSLDTCTSLEVPSALSSNADFHVGPAASQPLCWVMTSVNSLILSTPHGLSTVVIPVSPYF